MTVQPLYEARNVSKRFKVGSRFSKQGIRTVYAVDSVSLSIMSGETLGLIGESGCGKSTLGSCPSRLYDISGGQLMVDGSDISHLSTPAIAFEPKLIILDEPVSALDVSLQAQIVKLLADLQGCLNLTYVFIAHDLSVVRQVSACIAVMYLGSIVELGHADDIFSRPSHPYTQALISAVPAPNVDRAHKRKRIVVTGDVPSPVNPPSGCRFHPRSRSHKLAAEQTGQHCQRRIRTDMSLVISL
jgi:oligopeptide/dipeptide ABC transporter ATP-binding protein